MIVTTDSAIAAAALAHGDLAALPTETVYGLGALASSAQATRRIYAVKGRPANHPVIVHVAGIEGLLAWGSGVPQTALTLANALWPGPLTLVVPRAGHVSDAITGGQPTVALRAPAHPLFQQVLADLVARGIEAPGIAAPSANRFGRVSPTTAAHVVNELGDRLNAADVVLDGGPCAVGIESTIVIAGGQSVRIAREGLVTRDQLAALVDVESAGDPGLTPRLPGSLESHYAPRAQVVVLGDEAELESTRCVAECTGLIALAGVPTPQGWHRLAAPSSDAEYARLLYCALRSADDADLLSVVAVAPPNVGIGRAVRDRLYRASGRVGSTGN